MPATSKAQVRWSYAAAKRGDLTPKQAKDFQTVDYKSLPERKKKRPFEKIRAALGGS